MYNTASTHLRSSVIPADCGIGSSFEALVRLQIENAKLRQALDKAYISTNFGCYTRAGGEALGNEYLLANHDLIVAGKLAMVCCDVIAMSAANQRFGELEVNHRVQSSLEIIKKLSGVHFISQINSGDEFGFIVNSDLSKCVQYLIDQVFKLNGLEGAYTASMQIDKCNYIDSANKVMFLIYDMKVKRL